MSIITDLSVVRHPPIREQIATTLRSAIINRTFAPGQVLVERDLCDLTGASRPSVREALRQLEAEGLVESRNGRGTVVRVLTNQEVSDLYEVRAELEGLAAGLFAVRSTDQEREQLHRAMENLRHATQAPDQDAAANILEAQAEFYGVLFSGAKNKVLENLIQGLQVRLAQLRSATLVFSGRAEQSCIEFQSIVEAIDSGQKEAARAAAAKHVENAASVMAKILEEQAHG